MTRQRFVSAGVGFVAPVPGLKVVDLKRLMPVPLRGQADVFLARVVERVELFVCSAQLGDEKTTPGDAKDALESLGQAAHTMRNALEPVAHGSRAMLELERHSWQREDPVRLLRRLDADLRALRAACELAVPRIRAARRPPKYGERDLVRWIAEDFRACYGKTPPQRSWFANDFLRHIGETIGRPIGARLVVEVVASMR